MIKRLIFDVDGTLITGVNFVDAIKRTLKRLDIYSDEKIVGFLEGIKTYENKFNNYNIDDYTAHMSNAIDNQLPKEFLRVFFEELKDVIPSRNETLIKTIKELSNVYELVLLTNYFSESQLNRLNNMEIGKFFKEIHGEKLIKSNLNAYLNACGKNESNECVMIGDDLTLDIEFAKKAGLHTIFVNSKRISNEDLNVVTVQSVIEINEKLIEILERSEV